MPKHTPGPWTVPHFARDEVRCNCESVLAEDYFGGIARVYRSNGLSIADGGNDCPPLEEAKANARLIAKAPEMYDILHQMLYMRQFSEHDVMKLLNFIDTGKKEIEE